MTLTPESSAEDPPPAAIATAEQAMVSADANANVSTTTTTKTTATSTTNNNSTNNGTTDDIHELSHAAKVQKTQDQMNAIAEAVQQSQALTSILLPLVESLQPQYSNSNSIESTTTNSNEYFLLGIDYLSQHYQALRTTRGDGNCFYRAVWYQLCDRLLQDDDDDAEGKRLLKFVKDDSMILATTKGGYEELALEIFYDEMVAFLEKIVVEKSLTAEQLHEQLNEEGGVSEYCTWYLRALTATWCKAHADKFLPYLEEPFVDVTQFCSSQIEPVGSEATMVAIVAFAECFGVTVSIEYLDGHAFDVKQGLTKHVFGGDDDKDSSKLQLTLLYRPGHYDILYRKKK